MRQEEDETASERVVEPGEEGGSGEAASPNAVEPRLRFGPLYTQDRQNQFIEALKRVGTVAAACRVIKGDATSVRRWRAKDEAFDLACLDALESFKEDQEEEMWRRATKGVRQ